MPNIHTRAPAQATGLIAYIDAHRRRVKELSERELTAERTYKLLTNVRGADVADTFHRVTIDSGYDFQVSGFSSTYCAFSGGQNYFLYLAFWKPEIILEYSFSFFPRELYNHLSPCCFSAPCVASHCRPRQSWVPADGDGGVHMLFSQQLSRRDVALLERLGLDKHS